MRVLSLDIGRRKTGVAISENYLGLVTPLKPVIFNLLDSPEEWFFNLSNVLESHGFKLWDIGTVVIGSWKDNDYPNKEMKKLVKSSENVIRKKTDWEVIFIRETYTSIESREILKSMGIKEKRRYRSLDSYAASLLLIDYLELVKPRLEKKTIS